MDTLIIGNRGQLGRALQGQLSEGDTVGVDLEECDATNSKEVAATFEEVDPRLVFNTCAYNAVDRAETDWETALAVNGLAPGRIAARCRERDAVFVHYSTDYVFGDGYTDPIDESRSPSPLSRYGRSKLLGERLALQNNARTFVVRTTGLYSAQGQNFVRTMIKHALAGTELNVVNDQFVSPTWVEPLATASIELASLDVYGIYHITAQGGCSWYELAGRTFEILGLDADLHSTTSEEYGSPARRPPYSVLDDALLRAVGLERLERWDDMLERFLRRHGDELIEQARRDG